MVKNKLIIKHGHQQIQNFRKIIKSWVILLRVKEFFLLLMVSVTLLFSCKKKYSFEGAVIDNSPAIYNFTGSPGLCTNVFVAGIFQAGISLNITNAVTFSVNVSKAGKYAVTTSLADGISFSGAGSFSKTGVQMVILTGSGVPAVSGSFNFTPTVNGCSFPVNVLAATSADSPDIYYEATIDGIHYKQTVTANNGYESGSTVAGFDDAIPGSNISPSVQPIAPNQTQMAIIKGVLHNYLSITNSTFKDFFTPGDYPWVIFGHEGVSLAWTDGNGINWSTYNIPGTQTESNFTIISSEDAPALTGYHIKVKAKFNCKLYDVNGNVKTLSNGVYVGYFGKI